jgi:hypothetical protein
MSQVNYCPVLYVQLRACPVGVYGRAFPDFRQMFSATKKSRVPRPSRVLCGRAGILTSCRSRRCLESGDSPRRGFRADSAEREEFKIPPFGKLRAGSVAETATRTGHPISVRGPAHPFATKIGGAAPSFSRFLREGGEFDLLSCMPIPGNPLEIFPRCRRSASDGCRS